MKTVNAYIALLFSLLSSLYGCSDFLDQEPTDTISNADALSSYKNVTYSLNGVYNGLCANTYYYSRYMTTYGDVTAGNTNVERYNLNNVDEYNYLYNFTLTPELAENSYAEIYEIIYAANQVIEAAPLLTDATEKQKASLSAQAKALRALCHFDLLRLYAQNYRYTEDASHPGIVLRMSTSELDVESSRNTVAECYVAIESDLQEAASQLDDLSNINYFSKQSAQALLARLYLYKRDWSNAAALANEVISADVQQLAPIEDYEEMWANDYESKEYLLRADASAVVSTSLSNDIGNNPLTTSKLQASEDLMSLFNGDDIRGIHTMIIKDEDSLWVSMKYPYVNNIKNNVSIIRISEVYLTRAEAYAQLGRDAQAQNDLNTIRQRAWPDAPEAVATGQELIEEILLERRKELAFEGHWFFDLTRNQRGVNREDCNITRYNCNMEYPNGRFVMPIPSSAIYANRLLDQNEAYK